MTRDRTRDEDDARADDFRCRGCETPLPPTLRRAGYCGACKRERGLREEDDA
jgi:hypothetical protein